MEIIHQMKFHELQALWWISAANNGHYKKDRSMETAQRHMRFYRECAEAYQEQKEKENNN